MKRKLFFVLFLIFYTSTIFNTVAAQSINTIIRTDLESVSKNWWEMSGPGRNTVKNIACDDEGNIYYLLLSKIIKRDRLTGKDSIIAGQGTRGFGGDGSRATWAFLDNPSVLVVDKQNNIIIADQLNFRIRKINTATALIETIAGNGINGYNGDGGLAINAKLGRIYGMAIDTVGNILFCDEYSVIRKVDAQTGNISTYAGKGVGIASRVPVFAQSTYFRYPKSIAIDKKNNVYIADEMNGCIRKIDAATKMVSIFAGSDSLLYVDSMIATEAKIYGPRSICFDNEGNLFVLGFFQSIKKISVIDNRVYSVCGREDTSGFYGDGGNYKQAIFSDPRNIAYNKNNSTLLINDWGNARIREISFDKRSPIVAAYIDYCFNDVATPLLAIGENLKWYDKAVGGIPFLETPIPNTSVVDTFTYFVSQTIGGIESTRSAICVYIKPGNDNIGIYNKDLLLCGGSNINDLFHNISHVQYQKRYNFSYDANQEDTIGIWVLKDLKYGRSKIFVRVYNYDNCPSRLDSFEIFVKDKLPLPKFTSPLNLCRFDPEVPLHLDGENLLWYSDTLGSYLQNAPTPRTYAARTKYYYFKIADTLGCTSNYGELKVVVNNLPETRPKVKTQVIYCEDDVAVPFEATGDRMSWHDSDFSFISFETPTPSTKKEGSYVTLVCNTTEIGCKGEYVEIETIVHAKPSIKVNLQQVIARTGYPIKLSASSNIGQNFKWNTGDTEREFSYMPTNGGQAYFWVISTSAEGCRSDTSKVDFYVNADQYWDSKINFYPNPFKDFITVTGLNLEDIRSINLRTTNGVLVAQSVVPSTSYTLHLPDNIPPGYYIIEVNTIGMANPSKVIFKQ